MLLEIIVRSFLAIFFLQILAKISGPKQIAQLSFYDYVVGISIGSIAAELAIDTTIPWFSSLISMAIFTFTSIFFSYLTTKSIFFRKHLTGTPFILIFHGNIIQENLEKVHFDVNDLLTQCRCKGYYDLSTIDFAIMETNGQVSFLLKSEEQPLTCKDHHLQKKSAELFANVIIDGKINEENLQSIGKNKKWLLEKLNKQKENSEDILLAIANRHNKLIIYKKNEVIHSKNYFI